MIETTFKLKHKDGTDWLEINPGTINESTSLELPGYGYSGDRSWTHIIDQDLLYLLENFASSTSPLNPTTGQLWYDTNNKSMNVYDNGLWKRLSNIYIQDTTPKTSNLGEFWFNTYNNRMAYYNGDQWVYITDNGIPTANTISVDPTNLKNTAFESVRTLQEFFDVLTNFRTPGSILCTDNNGKLNILPFVGDISLSESSKIKNYFAINTPAIEHDVSGYNSDDNAYVINPMDSWYHLITGSDPNSYINISTIKNISRPTTILNMSANPIFISSLTSMDFIYTLIPVGGHITFMYNNESANKYIRVIDTNITCSNIDQNCYANVFSTSSTKSFNFNGIIDRFDIYNQSGNNATVSVQISCVCADSVVRQYYIVQNININNNNKLSLPIFGVNQKVTVTSNRQIDYVINGKYQADLKYLHIDSDGLNASGLSSIISVISNNEYTVTIDDIKKTYNSSISFNIPKDNNIQTTIKCKSNYGLVCGK